MKSLIYSLFFIAIIVAVFALFSSCAVTTAPIKSSSETSGNTSEASSKFTSSTSPGGGSSSESKDEAALTFTNDNFARVKSDMAVGGGEYMESLSTLLDIPDSRKPEFFAIAKNSFGTIVNSEHTSAEEMLAKLKSKISAHPELKN